MMHRLSFPIASIFRRAFYPAPARASRPKLSSEMLADRYAAFRTSMGTPKSRLDTLAALHTASPTFGLPAAPPPRRVAPLTRPTAPRAPSFVQVRTEHLRFAIGLMQTTGVDDHTALARTVAAKQLSPEQALQLEDALARYGIAPDITRAIDETPNSKMTHASGRLDSRAIGLMTTMAASALSAASSPGPSMADERPPRAPRRRRTVSQSAFVPHASISPPALGLRVRAPLRRVTAPTGPEQVRAPSPSASTPPVARVIAAPRVLPRSGAVASRQAFASTRQSDSVWANDFGYNACTFVSIENLKAFDRAPGGHVTPHDLDVAMATGVRQRGIFAQSVVGDEAKALTPATEPLVQRAGYTTSTIAALPVDTFGQILEAWHAPLVAQAVVISPKSSIVTAGAYTIAVGRRGAETTIFDSHGDTDVTQPGAPAAYAVTFTDAAQAEAYLTRKLHDYVAEVPKDPNSGVFEVYEAA